MSDASSPGRLRPPGAHADETAVPDHRPGVLLRAAVEHFKHAGREPAVRGPQVARSSLRARLAEPEPHLRAALEDSPLVGELVDDP